jgi:D-alanyl-D-alanine carboxypeptidase
MAAVRILLALCLVGTVLAAVMADRHSDAVASAPAVIKAAPLALKSPASRHQISTRNTSNTAGLPALSAQDSAQAVRGLQERINGMIAAAGLGKDTKMSVRVISLADGQALYEKNPDLYLTPASTTKLFSTFAAMHVMGGDYMVPTTVYTDGQVQNGILQGNLYLKGHGDALLSAEDIEALAAQIAGQGIHKVQGTVFADASYFDNITERHIYSGDNEVVEPLAPITALGMNRNVFTVFGGPAGYGVNPASDAVNIVRTGRAAMPAGKIAAAKKTAPPHGKASSAIKSRKNVAAKGKIHAAPQRKKKRHADLWWKAGSESWELQRRGDAPPWPAPAPRRAAARAPAFSVSTQLLNNGIQQCTISGGKNNASAQLAMKQPDMYVAGVLRHKLRAKGIEITGGVMRRPAPASARILAEFRRPLRDIVALVNKNSDNFLAEHIFKMVGAYTGGQANTGRAATNAVKKVLSEYGIPTDGVCINDGSGLCRKNLFSASVQTLLLEKASICAFADAYAQSLSIAGVDGTLRRRMKGTAAESNLNAKTGTLRNASALTGYVQCRDGGKLAFSMIFNGVAVGAYKQLENRIGAALADFSYHKVSTSVGMNSR